MFINKHLSEKQTNFVFYIEILSSYLFIYSSIYLISTNHVLGWVQNVIDDKDMLPLLKSFTPLHGRNSHK